MYRIIFEHYPKEGQKKEFINQWQKGSDIIQTSAGALGTKLFRDVDNPQKFFAIAEWESKEARDLAMEKLEKHPKAEEILHGHEKFVESHKTVARLELIAESSPPVV